MTGLLERALRRVEALSQEEQDAIASQIMETLDDEVAWARSFRERPALLRSLAHEALEEHRRGKTRPLDELVPRSMETGVMSTGVDLHAERSEIKERIKHENDLIHQRMSWFSTFQGLLFGAVAFAWDKTGAEPILFSACVIGLLVSLSVGLALYRANVAIDRASARWDEIKPVDYEGIDSEGVRSGSRFAWLMPGRFIPWVFALMWVCVLVVAINR